DNRHALSSRRREHPASRDSAARRFLYPKCAPAIAPVRDAAAHPRGNLGAHGPIDRHQPSRPFNAARRGQACRRRRRQTGDFTMKILLMAAALVVVSWGAAPAQDAAAGEAVFRQCLPCHSVGEGAKNKVGPELNGLDGRKAGTAEAYSYSEAN